MNVFDHVLKPKDVLLEIKRVLKKHGTFILDLPAGNSERADSMLHSWESIAWDNRDTVLSLVQDEGYKLISQRKTKGKETINRYIFHINK